MNKVKAFFFSILKWFFSWGATPYLVLLTLIFIFTHFTWDDAHDEIRRSLIVELLGAMIILTAVDSIQSSWRKKLEKQEALRIYETEEKEALRIKKNSENEAHYRLKIAYELILPYAAKYRDYTVAITTDIFDYSVRDPSKFKFTDLIYFYQFYPFPDTPSNLRVYHQYFACLSRLQDEVNRAIFNLKPAYHFDIIELYKKFSQNSEEAYRLYIYFQSIENKEGAIDNFLNEMEKASKATKSNDADFLDSQPNILKPYVKLYNLTINNNQILLEQSELIMEKLKAYRDDKNELLHFEFD